MYFDKFTTEVEIKERFRKLAKHLHPDVGGDTELMIEIMTEYNQALRAFQRPASSPEYFTEEEEVNPYKIKIDMICEWAELKPSFDLDFVESLKNLLAKGIDLTPNQENAIDRIIEVWKIKPRVKRDRGRKYKCA